MPWDASRTLGAKVVRELLAIGWSKDAVPEHQLPAVSRGRGGPDDAGAAGRRAWSPACMWIRRIDPRGMTYHWLNFRRGDRQQGPESDYDALRAGKIVVTPLRYDRTDDEAYALCRQLPRFEE